MGIVHELVRWYKLSHGRGAEMRDDGASVECCPHCGNDTPVYRSRYDAAGNPVSFSVCLWCEGLIEFSEAALSPHRPYASATEIRAANERARRRRWRELEWATPPRDRPVLQKKLETPPVYL